MSLSIIQNTVTSYSLYAYSFIVGLGFINGSYSGCVKWCNWLDKRNRISINSPLYDSTLNTCRDCAYWGFFVLQGGFGSAFLVATAPISVPILAYLASNENDGEKKLTKSN